MQCDIKKCKFHAIEITYLDLIVSCNDIKMNSVKIKTIVDWKNSQNIHDVQAFFKFVNFYQQFIQYFSKIVQFLMNLIKKNMKFLWDTTCEHTFNNLKKIKKTHTSLIQLTTWNETQNLHDSNFWSNKKNMNKKHENHTWW